MTIKGTIPAHPVKSFFVHMLTRDIELRDAILDLLDNCIDGVQRSATQKKLQRRRPYEGYWAKITLSKDELRIEDNCGGIPWDFHDYAFRMGPLKKALVKGRRTIGTYGIGMKRAIFKVGTDCLIKTHAQDGSYQLHFSPEWMSSEDTWDLEAEDILPQKEYGTSIKVTNLRATVRHELESETFRNDFYTAVSTHYAYIIGKGFTVYVTDEKVEPKEIRLLFAQDLVVKGSKHEIRPFIYEATHNGVEIFLAVGFARPIPSKEEADVSFEDYKDRYSSADAGWTVICNDRTVAYCDKSPMMGWGVSGVPQYHMQFIAISGIVVFTSDDASLLPTTTTKRGIEARSELYLHVKDKMVEGMKIFTSYTNAWKGKELVSQSREAFKRMNAVGLDDLQLKAASLAMSSTHGVLKGKQYKPDLPRPTSVRTRERISFTRDAKEVRLVSKHLFGTPNEQPSKVGEECFRLFLKEASE